MFGNTEGALITQQEVLSGGGIAATAKRGSLVQRRSAPKEWEGDNRRAGWEFIEFLDLPGEAPRVRDEAVTRVHIDSTDGQGRRWSTVGVSPNIVDASFQALLDAIQWKLIRDGAKGQGAGAAA